jgi:DnaJ-class molecular chaperone
MTFYEFFEVKEDATREEIRAAYRKMLLRWHPDHCKDPDAENNTREILRIMKVLGDPEERARYDAYLAKRRKPVSIPTPIEVTMTDTFTNTTMGGWGRTFHTSTGSGFTVQVDIF